MKSYTSFIAPSLLPAMLGLTGMLSLSTVIAAPPISFDGWSVVTNSVIDTTSSCAAISCQTLVEDPGFLLQEIEVDVADGKGGTTPYKFFRIIVTDKDAGSANANELNFSIENFIPFAHEGKGEKQGIASHQAIRDTSQGYSNISIIQRDSFKNSTDPGENFNTHIAQTLNQADLSSLFDYKNYTQLNQDDTTTVIGRKLDISFEIAAPTTTNSNAKLKFDHRQRGGFKGTDSSIVSNALTTSGNITLSGETISWNDTTNSGGDAIVSTWMADTINFNIFQSVKNTTKTDAYASEMVFNASGTTLTTLDWDDNFGATTAPTL